MTAKKVQGEDLAAEILSKREARENATKLLRETLAGLPKVLVATVQEPTARDYDESRRRWRSASRWRSIRPCTGRTPRR